MLSSDEIVENVIFSCMIVGDIDQVGSTNNDNDNYNNTTIIGWRNRVAAGL